MLAGTEIMATIKEKILDHISRTEKEYVYGVSTSQLADHFQLKRSNVSAVLNTLVKEGRLEKSNGRPVLYHLKHGSAPDSSFSSLVGAEGSLAGAIKKARSFLSYPGKFKVILLSGLNGNGKKHFAEMMYTYL